MTFVLVSDNLFIEPHLIVIMLKLESYTILPTPYLMYPIPVYFFSSKGIQRIIEIGPYTWIKVVLKIFNFIACCWLGIIIMYEFMNGKLPFANDT
jgi:hypothetical protein